MKKINLGADFLDLINTGDWLEHRAESHLNGWKTRYIGKTKKQVSFDLNINHDPSIEIEIAEEDLNRKLTDHEYNYLVDAFNKRVVKKYTRNFFA